jgi:branched-chain amino acid transport system ATP-binding protein
MLEVRGVSVAYDRVQAVRDVSLDVERGEIVALIGANGAGKTTTLRCISGLVRPAAGTIRFEGSLLERRRPAEIVGLGVSHVPEGRRIFPRMTVVENLELGAYREAPATARQRLDDVFGLFPVLRERAGQLAATLSGGEQQMLAIGRALMAGPRLLLLDEPSLGLAPIIVRGLFQALLRIRRAGVTMLLVEQNARLALQVCDRAYVLERGAVACSGPSAAVAADERIVRAYLGTEVKTVETASE